MIEPVFTRSLKDGTEVVIRTVDPCDERCISDGFDRLSPRSRHLRFFAPISGLSKARLTQLTEVDNENHVVIAASEAKHDEPAGIGLARYVRLAEARDIAEFAITVVDAYQGRGAGGLLLDIMIEHAREHNVSVLRGYVLEANEAMIRLLQGRGAKRERVEDGAICFEFHLGT